MPPINPHHRPGPWLNGINLSKRFKQRLLCDPAELSPTARAVRIRAQLFDLGYRVLIMTPLHMQIAGPEAPNRFQGYHIDQAERLLEKLYE